MKRLPIVLAAATLALSGCGLFATHHAWKEAQQENPLQIPPGMDRPSTTAALTIPPPAKKHEPEAKATALAANATSMHLADDVATAYKRVGLALQNGDIGTVTAQDEAQHTYRLSVSSKPVLGTSQSFLQKHFSNINQQPTNASAINDDAAAANAVVVTLKVAPSKGGGSTISASGDPQQSVRVISVLDSRLAG